MAKKKSAKAKSCGGPFLAAAIFCENFLEDAKRVSAIGVVDGCTFYLAHDSPPDVPSESQPVMAMQNVLIIFRSGDSPGKHRFKLVMERPDGKRKIVQEREVEFSNHPHGGLNLRIQAVIQAHMEGVYWIDVILDGKKFTRMPFNISFQRLPPNDSGSVMQAIVPGKKSVK